MMNIDWPQGIWIALVVFILVMIAFLHGKEKKPDKFDFFQTAFFLALQTALMAWGGFFS